MYLTLHVFISHTHTHTHLLANNNIKNPLLSKFLPQFTYTTHHTTLHISLTNRPTGWVGREGCAEQEINFTHPTLLLIPSHLTHSHTPHPPPPPPPPPPPSFFSSHFLSYLHYITLHYIALHVCMYVCKKVTTYICNIICNITLVMQPVCMYVCTVCGGVSVM
ncbi:hypothetical protein DM02DRAFT_168914 [Periconia macrospinosa]|uniref:Uncharacterized protein n=1 Tax=Periconia macrospinosa TaxID=97972 RepID=A0A2V1DAK2_9PLEO|nr:hypothetical protein DM02DRAFT_168914 [Periconia macrospinosa]